MNLSINLENIDTIKGICGANNQNIKLIEELYNIKLELLSDEIIVSSNDDIILKPLEKMFNILLFMLDNQYTISSRDIIYIKNLLDEGKEDLCYSLYKKKEMLERNFLGKAIYPKTLKQREYINSLQNYDIVFGVGPAGTGKTYLAVVYAVSLLKKGIIKHLVLTRPAVEAGESLGFLPGDLKEKIDPYLRPLYDALYDTLGLELTNSYIERGVIEIAPLAYMRGRTLENTYAILDEAQNTTQMQMKMFLTRLGFNSKMVITGDISQIDLPSNKKSGLVEACMLFKNVKQIGIVKFEKMDVVRHPLVQIIIDKYEGKEVK
jgi:phosphate starvation-induced protein phoH